MGLDVYVTTREGFRLRKMIDSENYEYQNRDFELLAEQNVELDSPIAADHLFKIGYWRSSYNDGGINRVLGNTIGFEEGLWGLLSEGERAEAEERGRVLVPDWAGMLARAQTLLSNFEAWVETHGDLTAYRVSANMFCPDAWVRSEKQAMDTYLKEAESQREHAIETKQGEFCAAGKPLQVLAIMPGEMETGLGGRAMPCAYVVEQGDPGRNVWYVTALRIVVETIEWVLAQSEPTDYGMVWSY